MHLTIYALYVNHILKNMIHPLHRHLLVIPIEDKLLRLKSDIRNTIHLNFRYMLSKASAT